jgi:hypothetical protein
MFNLFNYQSVLSLFFLFNFCSAHTNQICTSTGGTNGACGSAKFILTTYHGCPSTGTQTPGQLYIQTPTGTTHTFSFSSYCPMSSFNGPGPSGSPLSNQCSQELSNKCGNNNADVTCYYKPDTINMVGAVGDDTCKAGNTQSYQCAYYSEIINAVTGNYIVWTTGTDANLDPCFDTSGGKIPCDFTESNKVTIPLTIQGCGSSCTGSPPTPSGVDQNSQLSWTATVDLNSCSAAYDGIQCSVSCPSGFSQSGSLYCDNGNWVNSLVCVDQNYINYCHSGSDCSGNGVTTDTNRQDGCDCTCDPGYIGSDCSVTAPQPTQSPTSSQTPSPTTSPTKSPTPQPTLNPTPQPTLNPTPQPTLNPTPQPTLNPTPQPTDVPTREPTSSPTNHPTACPTSPPTSSPSRIPTTSPSYTPKDNKFDASKDDDDDKKGLIAVYVIIPLIVLLLIIYFLCYRRRQQEEVTMEQIDDADLENANLDDDELDDDDLDDADLENNDQENINDGTQENTNNNNNNNTSETDETLV